MYIKSVRNIADTLAEQLKNEDLVENPHWRNLPEFLMEAKVKRPSQKPVFNSKSKETMGKELILQSDELKLKWVTSKKKKKRNDSGKICAHNLESVYNVIATEKQPDMKTSEIKSIMEQNCWSLSMKNFIYVYMQTHSFTGNPKPIENVKLKSLTVLHFGKEKQCLIRQVQSVHYSEEWSKNKAVEYSKGHSLELLLGKKKIRWKDNYEKLTCSEAKGFNHLVWHKIINLLIHCCGIFILEIIVQKFYDMHRIKKRSILSQILNNFERQWLFNVQPGCKPIMFSLAIVILEHVYTSVYVAMVVRLCKEVLIVKVLPVNVYVVMAGRKYLCVRYA